MTQLYFITAYGSTYNEITRNYFGFETYTSEEEAYNKADQYRKLSLQKFYEGRSPNSKSYGDTGDTTEYEVMTEHELANCLLDLFGSDSTEMNPWQTQLFVDFVTAIAIRKGQ